MTSFSFQWDGPEFNQQWFGGRLDDVSGPITDWTKDLLNRVKTRARSNVPKDTKRLSDSIQTRLGSTPGSGEIEVGETYGVFVEKGTRPHFPPIAALEGWATRHGINPYAVQWKIGQEGTKATNFLQEAWDFHTNSVGASLAATAREIEGRWDQAG